MSGWCKKKLSRGDRLLLLLSLGRRLVEGERAQQRARVLGWATDSKGKGRPLRRGGLALKQLHAFNGAKHLKSTSQTHGLRVIIVCLDQGEDPDNLLRATCTIASHEAAKACRGIERHRQWMGKEQQ